MADMILTMAMGAEALRPGQQLMGEAREILGHIHVVVLRSDG
jgi:hypothetical protein